MTGLASLSLLWLGSLLRNERSTGRQKDLIDVEQLERLRDAGTG